MIGDDIELTVLSVQGEKVRLGIQAPSDVPVFRTEIYGEIKEEREQGNLRTDVIPKPNDAPSARDRSHE